jgi:hypothetical protein
MSDQALMQSIKEKWGAAIATTCAMSNVPPAFLAALIAGESGGNENAKRFEPRVLSALWEVLLGRKAAYGSISTRHLIQFVANTPAIPSVTPQSLPADALQRLDSLATSWGLTQIMGYEVLDPVLSAGFLGNLQSPASELPITLRMLAQFAEHFALDVTKNFSEMFDCWNTGRPHSATFDPQYIPNGIARMAIYEALP